ncbi:MAG: PDZ domain-containing protein [Planctomycetota bacterium]|nr:PDZ domain-containing protein [Planctomycetota bacterium]
MTRRVSIRFALLFVMLASGAAWAGEEAPKAEELARLGRANDDSFVRVEYTLRYDKGESPESMGYPSPYQYRRFMSFPGQYSWESLDEVIREERPLERGGWLVAADLVATEDPMIHPRFVSAIVVRAGEHVVDAVPEGYAERDGLLFLRLAAPLEGAEILSFQSDANGPYYALDYRRSDASWQTSVQPLGTSVAVMDDGRQYLSAASGGLVVNRQGTPVALTATAALSVDETWKQPASRIPMVRHDEWQAGIDDVVKEVAERALPRVTLNFRSPRSDQASPYGPQGYYYGEEQADETEWNGTGVLVTDELILVLASLKPDRTARLEQIVVHTADGEAVEAEFVGSLRDYGALLARLPRPRTDRVEFCDRPMTKLRDRLLARAEIIVHGENRTSYYHRDRVQRFFVGWEGRDYPAVAASTSHGGYYGYGDEGSIGLNFLLTLDGALTGLPIARRQKVTVEERWGGNEPMMVPVEHLVETLDALDDAIDPDNRPLSEEEESRIAWLGVELQAMNPDLARINEISHLTSGGRTGAIVTYVYEDSPAAAVGLELGDIILRLHIEGHPKPLEVSTGGYQYDYMEMFPWAQYDEIPPEFFEQLPQPWGSVDNQLNRALTQVGFGTPFVADVYREEEVRQRGFRVTESPPHYGAAARYKSEGLGVSVRDLTYEVRRYFQIAEDEPGVIIAKVEPGEKAAVAGLRPYEIIISINDEPIESVEEFETIVRDPGELRMFVKRMTEGRIVKIESEGEGEEEEEVDQS